MRAKRKNPTSAGVGRTQSRRTTFKDMRFDDGRNDARPMPPSEEVKNDESAGCLAEAVSAPKRERPFGIAPQPMRMSRTSIPRAAVCRIVSGVTRPPPKQLAASKPLTPRSPARSAKSLTKARRASA
jgi:hypothetical protein